MKIRLQYVDTLVGRAETAVVECCKSIIALNSGGVLATLGFLQAVVGKAASFMLFKIAAEISLATFMLGAIVCALVFLLRYQKFAHQLHETGHENKWADWSFFLVAAGFFAFVLGGVALVWGIANYL